MKLIKIESHYIESYFSICSECHKRVNYLVEIDNQDAAGGRVCSICKDCLKKALTLFPQESVKEGD